MADISLTADTSDVLKAVQQLQKFQSQVDKLVKRLETGSISTENYKQGLLQVKRAYADLGVSSQKASSDIQRYAKAQMDALSQLEAKAKSDEWAKQQRRRLQLMEESEKIEKRRVAEVERQAAIAEKAAKDEADAVERLRLKYNTAYAGAQQFKNTLRDLNNAHKLGAISTQQHATAVEKLKNDYRGFLSGAVGPMNQFGRLADNNTRSFKRFGAVGMQQVGYQVGDFAVQVQGGTNALVALGQQGSQLLGIFGAWGALAGAGLAIATAVGNVAYQMYQTKKASEDGTQGLMSYKATVKALKEELDSLYLAQQKIKTGYETDAEASAAGILQSKIKELEDARKALENLQNAGYYRGSAGDLAQAESLVKTLEKQTEELRNQQTAIEDQRQNLSELEILHNSIISAEESQVKSAEDIKKEIEDSVSKARDLKAEIGEAATNALMLAGIDITSPISDAAREAAVLAGNLGIALEAAAALQLAQSQIEFGFQGTSMASYGSRSPNSGKGKQMYTSDIGVEKSLNTIERDRDNLTKPERISSGGRGSKKKSGGSGGGGGGKTPREEYESLVASIDKAYAAEQKFAEGKKVLDKAYSTGVITLSEYQSTMESLTKDLTNYDGYEELRNSILGVSESQQELIDNQKLVNDVYEAGLISIDEYNKVMQALKQSSNETAISINESFSNEVGSAFSDLITGAKNADEAFRDMALSIVDQAFQLLAVKPIMDMLFGSNGTVGALNVGSLFTNVLANKNGNAFSGGSVIPFANGGVVDSPSLFPMSGNKTGLMGEAGAEAIMPLTRTSDGKLGVKTSGNESKSNYIFNISTPDVKGFQQSQGQIAGNVNRMLSMSQRNR